jgi:hypothetical protein
VRLLLIFVFVVIAAAGTLAQQTPISDLSDGWVRIDTEGSGDFGGLTAKFPPAVLTPAAAAEMKKAAAPASRFDYARDPSKPRAEGEAYIVTEGRCNQALGGGVPLEPNSAAFFMTQTRDKVVITREGAGARHLYLDGRPHPNLASWTPTNQGHSVARYEQGDLIVETIGITAGNVTAGGRRTPETKLTERFHLSQEGKRLTITYTWTDPKIYVKPHSYSLHFDRLPAESYAIEDWCDASDPRTSQSIVVPKQPQ